MIRGKLLVGATDHAENRQLLSYIAELEILLDDADGDDVWGTEGWRRRVGW